MRRGTGVNTGCPGAAAAAAAAAATFRTSCAEQLGCSTPAINRRRCSKEEVSAWSEQGEPASVETLRGRGR